MFPVSFPLFPPVEASVASDTKFCRQVLFLDASRHYYSGDVMIIKFVKQNIHHLKFGILIFGLLSLINQENI